MSHHHKGMGAPGAWRAEAAVALAAHYQIMRTAMRLDGRQCHRPNLVLRSGDLLRAPRVKLFSSIRSPALT